MGALHERFFKGENAGDESTLQEAGEVMGVGRPLTESEFLSMARVSDQAVRRSRWCCNLSDCVFVTGIIGAIATIGPAVYYLTTPIHEPLAEMATFLVKLVHATPMPLRCVITLVISMAFVCDGFRAADKGIGGRIALTGAVGAIASLWYSTMLQPWGDTPRGVWFWWLPVHQAFVLNAFSAAVLAPIAVEFDFSLGGFLAVVSAFSCAVNTPLAKPFWEEAIFGSLAVDGLFGIAILARIRPRALQPFCSGVMAMGVCFLHFMLYCTSWNYSLWYRSATKALLWPHVIRQLAVFGCLLAGWALGSSIGYKGLTNNTRLFGVLYVFTTIISLSERLPGRGGVSLGWTVVFLGLWRVGLYLHGHKDFVSSLWTLDAGLLSRGDPDDGDADGHRSPEVELLLGEGPALPAVIQGRREEGFGSCDIVDTALYSEVEVNPLT
eukprot:g7363.t1